MPLIRLSLAAALVAAALVAPASGVASERSFRLIAMDMRQDLADTGSLASYAAHLEERLATASAAFAADGRPTVVFLPEDAGLMSWLVGPRAAHARDAGTFTGNAAAAIASLGATHAPQIAYYEAKCPGIPPARALVLALTDTSWRAFGETLARLATEHGVYIVASHNVPAIAATQDPARVAVLGDPLEPARPYAYEGGCEVYNDAMVFAPGRYGAGPALPSVVLAGHQRKAYLVPIERTQDVGLAMTGELVANVRPVDLGFARLGILTSKDAWMPDVAERLDDLGAEVWLQPEAGAWAGHGSGLPDWPPDAMHRAIWAGVQRLPGFRYGALSNLTGNFFDLVFDGTATITKDADPADEPGWLLGRPASPGYVARAPWVVADPPAGVAMEDLDGRRAVLDAAGAAMAPGGAAANAYLEGFVWADITLPPVPAPAVRVARGDLAPSEPGPRTDGPQWNPFVLPGTDATSWDHSVFWTDLSDGAERPAFAVALPGGAYGGAAVLGERKRASDQQANAYDVRAAHWRARGGSGVQMIWSSFANQSWSIRAHGGAAVDDSPTTPLASAEGFGNENINHDPAITTGSDGLLYAAWADVRGRRVPWRIAVAHSHDGGRTWSENVRADGGGALERTTAEIARVQPDGGDQFAPAIAPGPGGRIWVAWQDHSTPEPRILVARSIDGTHTFEPPLTVAPGGGAQFRPAIAVAPDGSLALAWEEETAHGRRVRGTICTASACGPATMLDPSAPAGTTQARAALAFSPGGDLAVVFQDDRGGDRDLLLARSGAPVVRLDDGAPGSDALNPSIAWAGDGFVVAYEESERIRVIRAGVR